MEKKTVETKTEQQPTDERYVFDGASCPFTNEIGHRLQAQVRLIFGHLILELDHHGWDKDMIDSQVDHLVNWLECVTIPGIQDPAKGMNAIMRTPLDEIDLSEVLPRQSEELRDLHARRAEIA